jgi:hypothetical protein
VRWLQTEDLPRLRRRIRLAEDLSSQVELACPVSRRLISVQIGSAGECEKVEPADAVAVVESLDSDWHPRDWTRKDCATGLLFASADASAGWLAEHPGHVTVAMEFFVRSETLLHARIRAETDRLRGGGCRHGTVAAAQRPRCGGDVTTVAS